MREAKKKIKLIHGWRLHPLTGLRLDVTGCGKLSTKVNTGLGLAHLDHITADEDKMTCQQCIESYRVMYECREYLVEQQDVEYRKLSDRRSGVSRREIE